MPQHTWVDAAGGFPDPTSTSAFYDALNHLEGGIAGAVVDHGNGTATIGGYTPNAWTAPTTGTPVSASWMNDLEVRAGTSPSILAPAPSGGDDTAALQALLTLAQNTGGTLVLQAGTYLCNLTTAGSFFQPNIVGQGTQYTFLKTATAGGTVLTMVGGSGSVTESWVRDLCVQGSSTSRDGTGIALIGCGGVQMHVQFRDLTTGLLFHNRDTGMFTEFCVGQDCVWDNVTTPVHYQVTSGNESFHGSGVKGGVMSSANNSGCVLIDSVAFPYNAPLSPTVFTSAANTNVIVRTTGTRIPSFYGTLTCEAQGGTTILASEAGGNVYYAGEVSVLGGPTRLGNLYLADKVYYTGGNTYAQLKPYQRLTTLAPGTVGLTTPDAVAQNGTAFLINVNISAGNYFYTAQLLCWQSPFNSGGTVTTLSSSLVNNGSAAGAPTFTWTGYGLNVTNSAYSSAYTAYVGVAFIGANTNGDVLGQF